MGGQRRRFDSVERLRSRQLAELSSATLASARRLFNDATLLYDAGRLPSSFVLLGLATDELGKHVMVTELPGKEDTDAEWASFWARFRRHEAKLGLALYGAWLDDLLDLGDPMSGSDLHKRRLDATYVDLDPRDRSIVTPDSVVTAEMVRKSLLQIGRYLEFCEFSMAQADVSRLTEVFEHARKKPKANRDRATTLAQAMAFRYGLSDANAERLAKLIQDSKARVQNEPESDSDLFARIATEVLGIDISASEAAQMLDVVEQVRAERDGVVPEG